MLIKKGLLLVALLFLNVCSTDQIKKEKDTEIQKPNIQCKNDGDKWNCIRGIARDKIYYDRKITFYCDCIFKNTENEGSGEVIFSSCGYKPKNTTEWAKRLSWEHILPAEKIRLEKNCKNNLLCKEKYCCDGELDLHNLTPAINEINTNRSDYLYGIIEDKKRGKYGSCDFEKKKIKDKYRVEPKEDIRGDIARIYFYMRDLYGIDISEQEPMLEKWNKSDLTSKWECERDKRIKEIQGNNNPYLKCSYNNVMEEK